MTYVVEMEGNASARGLAYGETARHLIVECAARWEDEVGDDVDAVERALVHDSGFVDVARALTPELVEEIESIARASGVDARRVWVLNLLDEDWWVRRAVDSVSACSAFGVAGADEQPAILAQTMDLPSRLDGLQVLLDIRPDEGNPRVLAPAYAGIVATNALNEHGVGVCVNTLAHLPTSRHGLPVAFVIRHLAKQRSVADAAARLRAIPHASGQNYLVASPDAMIDFECGAGTVTAQQADHGRIAHTNHPLGEPAPDDGGVVANSGARLAALRRRLAAAPVVTAEQAEDILREPPLSRERDGSGAFTLYAVIMELDGEPSLRLASGPPTHGSYARFAFSAA